MKYEILFPWIIFVHRIVCASQMQTRKVKICKIGSARSFCKTIAYYLANTERTRKFDFYNENIMFNIYLTFAAFPTPLPSHYLLPLKKTFELTKFYSGRIDLEPVLDKKVKLLKKQPPFPFAYYSWTTFTVYF